MCCQAILSGKVVNHFFTLIGRCVWRMLMRHNVIYWCLSWYVPINIPCFDVTLEIDQFMCLHKICILYLKSFFPLWYFNRSKTIYTCLACSKEIQSGHKRGQRVVNWEVLKYLHTEVQTLKIHILFLMLFDLKSCVELSFIF